ncbi:nucleotide-diphospho-sugar transferase [Pterulicium gracile]|uniref:Nucleotide-diphospho-sugar transferase n=1 Tax=Pterulicium gracile TaxID=1884261 RepID=A0A5C3Q407_9AGAR|nr:nucleotide-diphospho-sugar transferase [Pterula gracilis]
MPMQSTPYIFTKTQDWLSAHKPAWRTYFSLIESKTPRVLEIGSWEGRSAVFLLLELCGAPGPSMEGRNNDDNRNDHFDLLQTPAGIERHRKFLHNMSTTGGNYTLVPQFSVPGLMSVIAAELASSNEQKGVDLVYIDGSHRADDTFLDAELAWRLVKKDGIMIFDDYHWPTEPESSMFHPKRGIDGFLKLHEGEWERLSEEESYQFVVRKTAEMRVGFLMGIQTGDDAASDGLSKGVCDNTAFEYGIHVALTIDSTYAMPAAVAISSLLSHIQSRVTFHVVDCGLSPTDKERLHESIPSDALSRATLHFIDLPEGSFAARLGATWAKLDLFDLLPVERCLYLDADTLVRADVQVLWDIDLRSNELGAVVDVGFPTGHSEIASGPYFNGGLLLLDLAKCRNAKRMIQLRQHAEACVSSNARFKDQDALNLHFTGRWASLDMRWNAQGLGTYAEQYTPERHAISERLDMMKADPWIVHFTGPVNPSMAAVLNPYVQPWLSKPWGYAGAPGHPFAGEWRGVLEETAWEGLAGSAGYKKKCEAVKTKAIEEAVAELDNRISVGREL